MKNVEMAQLFSEATPYIQKYHGKTLVIKYGGNAMVNDELKLAVMNDLVTLTLLGVRVVLVHGGGPAINEMLDKVGVESRFEGGLVADIQRPDFETRLAILRKKAEFEHLNISDDILALIAEKIDTNVRELEGSVTRLTAYSSLTRRPIDMQLAREALRELFKHSETRVITCDSIQDAVANYYGLSVEDLKSPKRNHEITVPRQIAMYLAREMMGLSLTRIGDAFGGRHYTTVMSSISKVEDSIKQSPSLVSLLDDIRRMIKNPT